MRLRYADRPWFLATTLNFFMARLVENYLNILQLPSNVVVFMSKGSLSQLFLAKERS